MEPLLPSEVARLVYGYLKEERNEETAECFLKSSVHLSECYQMFKTNRKFNIKFNGLTLHDIFDIFGTMCSMINNRLPEECKFATMIERLQYLLDLNYVSTKEDKCIATESNTIDKCVGDVVSTRNKSTCTSNENTSVILEMPSFTEMMSSNVSKTKETETVNEPNITVEKNPFTCSSPCLSSETQLMNNASIPNLSKNETNESNFQINKRICSTPTKNNVEPILCFSPHNVDNHLPLDGIECEKIPKATSLESMPGLSKEEEEEPKNGSVVIDTGELVDTFLNDQSLLEKLADTINKSIEAQKETDDLQEGKFLDPPTLEKALDSTQSDPQIKNVLDEFLVFRVDNSDDNKKTCAVDQDSSIKSRLRSAKKNDVASNKLKKTSSDIIKHIAPDEENKNADNNIVMFIQESNKETLVKNYDLGSSQGLQPNSPNVINNFSTTGIVQEDYTRYVKIAPKPTTMLIVPLANEKSIFPKRKKLSLERFGVKSKFRKTNITSVLPQATKSIVIEVPNQKSFEIEPKNNIDNNIIRLPEVSKILSEVKDTHDTPNNILKPPKSKSMSTPRRRSTHIRCLDFSTPQPKNNVRDQARSKLFCDSPKRVEKILEESVSSPLPKLQADWGAVNGFESIVSKTTTRHWDTDIREMVGAGILTSDADGRKTRKKKIPRKKIKPINDKNNSELVVGEENKSNNSMLKNESQSDAKTNKSNTFKSICDSNEHNCDKSLLGDEKSLNKQSELSTSLETSDKAQESYFKQPLDKSSNNRKSLENHNEFLISLDTPDKNTELYNEQAIKSNTLKNVDDEKRNEFPISLETPDKITELCIKQSIDESDTVKNLNDKKSFQKLSEFPASLETPDKITESCKGPTTIESNSLRISYQNSTNLEPTETDINEQENNLNQLNTLTTTFAANKSTVTSNSETVSETKKSKGKDPNFLETFNSHNCLKPLLIKQPENSMNKPTENVNKQISSDQIEPGHLNKINSPVKCVDKIQPVKHLVETPFKCDDSAVDVPETPISKLIREYDPNKLITPLPRTPEHDEDSLTETPLTKVFRETSYLNRPPISPFPPTPGNSRSVDTLLVQSDQECSKPSNGACNKINGLKEFLTRPMSENNESSIQTKKVKSTPLKTKLKPLTKSKIKSDLKEKSLEAKKKQVYEFVKVDLFGSEISSSSSADELENTNEQPKPIVINKSQEEDKKSGFKPIPKRKSIQPTSVLGNVIEKGPLDECKNTKINNSLSKPTIVSSKETKNTSNNKKSKKSMVHFDDPVGKIINMSTNSTLNKSKSVSINKMQNKILTKENPEQLIGLSRYLNKSVKFDECSYTNKKRSETIKCGVETSRLNNSDSINNSYASNRCHDGKISDVKPCSLNSETKTYDTKPNLNRSSDNRLMNENKESVRKENSTVLKKCTAEPLNSVKPTFTDTKNSISIKPATSITTPDRTNQSNSSVNNSNNSMNNTSCITVGHNDESYFQLRKFDVPLNNIEYLKTPKVYEVISEDDCHMMIHLHLSESFTFLDIPSELNSSQVSTSIVPPLVTNNKELDITPEIEINELDGMPATSTPKDIDEKQMNERQNRERRSPSFWDDSIHNYPVNKYRNDRHWESNRWKYKGYRDNRHDNRYRSKSRHDWNHFQRSNHRVNVDHHVNVKRAFRDDSLRDKERSKYKEDKWRSYRDYNNYDDRKGREFEESKWFPNPQRMLQNDIAKKVTKRPAERTDHKIPAKVSKVEHQRLLKNVNVDDFLSVVHGQK